MIREEGGMKQTHAEQWPKTNWAIKASKGNKIYATTNKAINVNRKQAAASTGNQRQSRQSRAITTNGWHLVAWCASCSVMLGPCRTFLLCWSSSLFGIAVASLSISNVLIQQHVCSSFVCAFKVVVLMLGSFGVCVMKAANLF